jgi:hypothetical protein
LSWHVQLYSVGRNWSCNQDGDANERKDRPHVIFAANVPYPDGNAKEHGKPNTDQKLCHAFYSPLNSKARSNTLSNISASRRPVF